MKVELLDLKKLVPYARNPRITAHAVDKVAASIKEFGFRQPIVVDSEMVIIAGHTRYQAAQKLGLKKVPVHVAEGLSAEQVKAYRIADNRTGEEAQWDNEMLFRAGFTLLPPVGDCLDDGRLRRTHDSGGKWPHLELHIGRQIEPVRFFFQI